MMNIIIPAHNEENYLGRCLASLLTSHSVMEGGIPVPVQLIVAANGCTDRTVEIARTHEAATHLRGWSLQVLDLKQASKPNALNAADAIADDGVLVYVDADIAVGPALLSLTWAALKDPAPRFASGRMEITEPATFASRAYRDIYMRVPFQTKTIPAAGYFAVNRAGRRRWDRFPNIIADDLFARLNFTPQERILVNEVYHWELAEGFRALTRVRRRQDRGTRELFACYPELAENEDKPGFESGELKRLLNRFPIGMVIYCTVSALARLPIGGKGWARARN